MEKPFACTRSMSQTQIYKIKESAIEPQPDTRDFWIRCATSAPET